MFSTKQKRKREYLYSIFNQSKKWEKEDKTLDKGKKRIETKGAKGEKTLTYGNSIGQLIPFFFGFMQASKVTSIATYNGV
jgi:hypothetical protein